MNKRLSKYIENESRVTIKTVANAVGVSVCTVNKALTGKPRISDEMRRRVIEAAEQLGYRSNRLARSLSRPVVRIGVVYPDAWPAHYQLLMDGARERLEELSDYRLNAEFSKVSDMHDGMDFIQAVRNMISNKFDGLILALGDYPAERRRLLWEMLRNAHLPFVLLGTNEAGHDVSPHLAVVEQDSRVCGQWAAEMLALMTVDKSPKAIMVGSEKIHDHALKIMAFKQELATHGAGVPLIRETHDLPERAEMEMAKLLKECPDLGGIYIATENLHGVATALERSGAAGKIKALVTGISEYALDSISSGLFQASVYQQEPLQGGKAVDILFQYLETGCRPPLETLVLPLLVMRSNMALFRHG